MSKITLTYGWFTNGPFQTPQQVKCLYRMVKIESSNPVHDSYVDAWDLRRLYTYAWRRQNDAAKRGQVPRDMG